MGKYDLKGVREVPEPPAPVAAVVAAAVQRNGRKPGKRSTPGYSRTTVYMREDTRIKAGRILEDRRDERDLSDLIEELVSKWVTEHTEA